MCAKKERELPLSKRATVELQNRNEQEVKSHIGSSTKRREKGPRSQGIYWAKHEGTVWKRTHNGGKSNLSVPDVCLSLKFR